MKILIVEDEPSLREIMVQTLRREQYVVEQASDYASALEKIAGYDYDCILLDIMLPQLSGMEVLRRLRKEGVQLPVLMLSAVSGASCAVTSATGSRASTWGMSASTPTAAVWRWPGARWNCCARSTTSSTIL